MEGVLHNDRTMLIKSDNESKNCKAFKNQSIKNKSEFDRRACYCHALSVVHNHIKLPANEDIIKQILAIKKYFNKKAIPETWPRSWPNSNCSTRPWRRDGDMITIAIANYELIQKHYLKVIPRLESLKEMDKMLSTEVEIFNTFETDQLGIHLVYPIFFQFRKFLIDYEDKVLYITNYVTKFLASFNKYLWQKWVLKSEKYLITASVLCGSSKVGFVENNEKKKELISETFGEYRFTYSGEVQVATAPPQQRPRTEITNLLDQSSSEDEVVEESDLSSEIDSFLQVRFKKEDKYKIGEWWG